MSQDKVLVEGLVVDAMIGVYDWEHEQAQPLVIDLTMAWDNKPAAAKDEITLALDYDHVSQAVTRLIQERPRQLIETVAEEIAALIQEQYSVPWLRVKVAKPKAVAAAFQVAVEIERGQL